MKICLQCQANRDFELAKCEACGAVESQVDGFPAFAPELAHGGGGFEKEFFDELADLEEENFWFVARNELILWCLRRYCGSFQRLLEVGCGTAFVLRQVVREFPRVQCFGSEIFVEGLSHAARRVPSAGLFQMDVRSMPFKNEFDVVGAFDVVEHVDKDSEALCEIHKSLKNEGFLILSVPQHEWLWSHSDDYAHHERRYTKRDLHDKLESVGFKIVRSTSFVSVLLPAMFLSRFLQRNAKVSDYEPTAELRIGRPLNFILRQALKFELLFIKLGIDFPIGGSRLVVAQKR